MSTIIECPACETRYKMNKPIPEGGRSVKCARCGHQWRLVPDEPEELTETLDVAAADPTPAPVRQPEPVAPAVPEAVPAATRYEPPAAPYEAPVAASYEPPAAAPASDGAAWAVRRGNLAAAIASMHESGDEREPEASSPNAPMSWDAEAGYPPRDRRMDQTVGEAFFGMTTPHEPEIAPAPAAAGPFGGDRPIWETDPSWMRGDEPAGAPASEIDPEISVREALRAALEDHDAGAEEPQGEVHGGGPVFGRPIFADPAAQDEPAIEDQGHAAGPAPMPAAPAEPVDEGDHIHAPADLAASKQEFSSRWRSFTSGHDADLDAPDPAPSEAPEESPEKFESDIAGIFRQELQAKRSFGPAVGPGGRRAQGNFTDYDMEAGSGTQAADDRYMADSPLDADAAALQAALEGSLRERHGEEGRSGGGLALAAAWAVFISVLSGVTLAFVSFRDEIVVALPGMAPLYRGIGLGVQDQQIDFGPVKYRWIEADGKPVIQVTGQIINLTDREIPVPRVLINIRDRESGDAIKATETLRSEPLAARETTDFTLEFMSPSKTISQIELAFAKPE